MVDAFQTLETRWFFPGSIPPEVVAWFHSLGDVQAQLPRTDLYLLGTGESLGVKLREGRVEMKKRIEQHGEVEFTLGVSGRVESWVKWSMAVSGGLLPDFGAAPHWAAVEKSRQMLYYRLDEMGQVVLSNPGSLPQTGGGLELTALQVHGQVWWTVGVEVFGKTDNWVDVLLGILVQSFENVDILWGCKSSYGYADWLRRI